MCLCKYMIKMTKSVCQCSTFEHKTLIIDCETSGFIQIQHAQVEYMIGNSTICPIKPPYDCHTPMCVDNNQTFVDERTAYWRGLCDGNSTCTGEVKYYHHLLCNSKPGNFLDQERVNFQCHAQGITLKNLFHIL